MGHCGPFAHSSYSPTSLRRPVSIDPLALVMGERIFANTVSHLAYLCDGAGRGGMANGEWRMGNEETLPRLRRPHTAKPQGPADLPVVPQPATGRRAGPGHLPHL